MRDLFLSPLFDWLGMAVWALLAAWAAVAWFKIFCAAMLGHGNVRFAFFQRPDLWLAIALMVWFGGSAMSQTVMTLYFGQEPLPITPKTIVQGALFYLYLTGGVFLFLRVRKLAPLRIFGLWKERGALLSTALAGGKFFLALFPIYLLASLLVKLSLGERADAQEMVKYFTAVVQAGDHGQVALMLFFGVVVAPLTEELLFRGYFYGVLRRFCGFGWALGITSLLFAAIHVNLAALLPLGILALCLTLAYEATGSLLAPVLMHAAFNASTFGMLYYNAVSGGGGV